MCASSLKLPHPFNRLAVWQLCHEHWLTLAGYSCQKAPTPTSHSDPCLRRRQCGYNSNSSISPSQYFVHPHWIAPHLVYPETTPQISSQRSSPPKNHYCSPGRSWSTPTQAKVNATTGIAASTIGLLSTDSTTTTLTETPSSSHVPECQKHPQRSAPRRFWLGFSSKDRWGSSPCILDSHQLAEREEHPQIPATSKLTHPERSSTATIWSTPQLICWYQWFLSHFTTW